MSVFLSSITKNNVNRMKLLWKFKTHSYVTAMPLYLNNKIFASDWAGYIYCLDARTGKLIYEKQLYKPPQQNKLINKIPIINKFIGEPLPYFWNGFAGTGCISNGIWYLSSVGGKKGGFLTNGEAGKIYAVNIENDEVLWKNKLADEPYSGSLATLTYDKTAVYTGVCSCEEIVSFLYTYLHKKFVPQSVGEVFAFDKFTGKKLWSRKTVGIEKNDNTTAKGAGVWGGLELDTQSNSLYFGTGNCYGRPVSNASDSVISVNKNNGNPNWVFQAVKNDAWLPLKRDGEDYDFGCTPKLFPNKNAIGAGNKNGYFYSLDSKTGKLLWKTFCHVNSTPDDGIRSNATFYNNKIYVWSKNKTPQNTMSVCCINPDNGNLIWNVITNGTNSLSTGGVTNGLYFLCNYDGDIFALDTETGKKVWSAKIKKASIGSNLAIYKNCIYGGMGLPIRYGGNPNIKGIFAYK